MIILKSELFNIFNRESENIILLFFFWSMIIFLFFLRSFLHKKKIMISFKLGNSPLCYSIFQSIIIDININCYYLIIVHHLLLKSFKINDLII